MSSKGLRVEVSELAKMDRNLGNRLCGSNLVGWRASGYVVDQSLPDAPVVHDNSVFGETVHFCRTLSVLHDDLLLLATVGAGPEVEPWVGVGSLRSIPMFCSPPLGRKWLIAS